MAIGAKTYTTQNYNYFEYLQKNKPQSNAVATGIIYYLLYCFRYNKRYSKSVD